MDKKEIKIGDQVIIEIDYKMDSMFHPEKVNLNGMKGFVTAFGWLYRDYAYPGAGKEPGVYEEKDNIIVFVPEFKILKSFVPDELSIIDENLQKFQIKRVKFIDKKKKISDLPKTKYFVDDIVYYIDHKHSSRKSPEKCRIINISYHELEKDKNSRYYILMELKSGSTFFAGDTDLILCERGNIWKFYNNIPLIFKDYRDMAIFYHKIGKCYEVKNPSTGIYNWTIDEAIEAIKSGIADIEDDWYFTDNKKVLYKYTDTNTSNFIRKEYMAVKGY